MIAIYYAQIDENDINMGLSCISLVDNPAVKSKFINFNDEQPQQMFFNINEEHRMITGVALRADFPIYRIDEEGKPYYIVFEPNTIEKMVKQYAAKGMFNNVSLQHNGQNIDGCHLCESYFINRNRGIDPEEFKDIEDFSWICSFHITDDNIWNEIKNGNSLKGFSVECYINLKRQKTEMSNIEAPQEAPDDPCDTFINEILN